MIKSGVFMKNLRVKILIFLIISIWAVNPIFSQNTLETLQTNVNKFTDNMAHSLPFNSTMGLNWSDGYIGQLTAIPPHFGVGISAGFTSMDFSSVKNLLELFELDLPVNNSAIQNMGLPIPGYTIEGRIGGIILPFDIGFKFGYLPPDVVKSFVDSFNYGLKHLLFGADIRYSLLNRKILIPKLSVGLGFNYMEGGITAPLPENLSYNFTDPNSGFVHKLTTKEANLGLEWRTISAEFKVQASFPFKFITPYAGAGISYAWSQAGYKVSTPELLVNDASLSDDEKKMLMEQIKVTGVSDKGFETINKFNGISARAYGGISINIAFLRIDFTGMYEFISGNLGATLGIRFQL
jgi:hypothetical protein